MNRLKSVLQLQTFASSLLTYASPLKGLCFPSFTTWDEGVCSTSQCTRLCVFLRAPSGQWLSRVRAASNLRRPAQGREEPTTSEDSGRRSPALRNDRYPA